MHFCVCENAPITFENNVPDPRHHVGKFHRQKIQNWSDPKSYTSAFGATVCGPPLVGNRPKFNSRTFWQHCEQSFPPSFGHIACKQIAVKELQQNIHNIDRDVFQKPCDQTVSSPLFVRNLEIPRCNSRILQAGSIKWAGRIKDQDCHVIIVPASQQNCWAPGVRKSSCVPNIWTFIPGICR